MILPSEKQVPDLELCQMMASLGFPQESLWHWGREGRHWYIKGDDTEFPSDEIIAAPTVAEIGEVLKKVWPLWLKSSLEGSEEYEQAKKYHQFCAENTEANARSKMWIWLKERRVI